MVDVWNKSVCETYLGWSSWRCDVKYTVLMLIFEVSEGQSKNLQAMINGRTY